MSDHPDNDLPLSGLTEDDPQNLLTESARRRIRDAHLEGELIYHSALAEVNGLWHSSGRQIPFSNFCEEGQGLLELRNARLNQARVVMKAKFVEYKAAGLPRDMIRNILFDEIDGLVKISWRDDNLSTIERDSLLAELRLYSTGTWEDQPKKSAITDDAHQRRLAKVNRILKKRGITKETFIRDVLPRGTDRRDFYRWQARKLPKDKPSTGRIIENAVDSLEE